MLKNFVHHQFLIENDFEYKENSRPKNAAARVWAFIYDHAKLTICFNFLGSQVFAYRRRTVPCSALMGSKHNSAIHMSNITLHHIVNALIEANILEFCTVEKVFENRLNDKKFEINFKHQAFKRIDQTGVYESPSKKSTTEKETLIELAKNIDESLLRRHCSGGQDYSKVLSQLLWECGKSNVLQAKLKQMFFTINYAKKNHFVKHCKNASIIVEIEDSVTVKLLESGKQISATVFENQDSLEHIISQVNFYEQLSSSQVFF